MPGYVTPQLDGGGLRTQKLSLQGGHCQPLGSNPVGWLQAAGGFVRLQGIPADARLGTNVLINCSVLQTTAPIQRCEMKSQPFRETSAFGL